MVPTLHAVETQNQPHLSKALDQAVKAAKDNSHNKVTARDYLYDAYEISFQMGDFSGAKDFLATAVTLGLEPNLWDQVALAEIFAREGKLSHSKRRLSFAISGFKQAHCKTDPTWNIFQTALESGVAATQEYFQGSNTPSLLQLYPETTPQHTSNNVDFIAPKGGFPEEMSVHLIIDNKGKVRCASIDKNIAGYAKMLTALKKRKFKPAQVNKTPVWNYGKHYVIRYKEGQAMTISQERGRDQKVVQYNGVHFGQ